MDLRLLPIMRSEFRDDRDQRAFCGDRYTCPCGITKMHQPADRLIEKKGNSRDISKEHFDCGIAVEMSSRAENRRTN